ncbi:MAG: hypothetical protein G01um101430_730 [Parcubacteria group bacterium Gr01-1014_30]|nr:MAG: hypothetical protein G01um101430_730 [Parcubacteria group bacterium Gr01-1014_30]
MKTERHRILIVDDDYVMRMLLKKIINSNFAGVSVVTTCSGQQGWTEFDADQIRPDLVLTDLGMETPLAGLELAQKIRAVSPPTPIILISAGDLRNVDVGNFNCCLEKPFRAADLVRKIAYLLNLQAQGKNN